MPSEDEHGTDPVADLADRIAATGYVADRALAMVLYLAQQLESPILLEGEPGVGKTSVAVQHPAERSPRWGDGDLKSSIFSSEFLLRRPLLDAIWLGDDRPVVLPIDEIDRADEEFEALLLELLSQFQITIPEIGTISAQRRPVIILTANRTRSLSDALRRRCLYHWIPFPDLDREIATLQSRLPGASALLVKQTCLFVERIRAGYYRKAPGISETLDWLRALTLLGGGEIIPARVAETIGVRLKDSEDMRLFREKDHERVYREHRLRVTRSHATGT